MNKADLSAAIQAPPQMCTSIKVNESLHWCFAELLQVHAWRLWEGANGSGGKWWRLYLAVAALLVGFGTAEKLLVQARLRITWIAICVRSIAHSNLVRGVMYASHSFCRLSEIGTGRPCHSGFHRTVQLITCHKYAQPARVRQGH